MDVDRIDTAIREAKGRNEASIKKLVELTFTGAVDWVSAFVGGNYLFVTANNIYITAGYILVGGFHMNVSDYPLAGKLFELISHNPQDSIKVQNIVDNIEVTNDK